MKRLANIRTSIRTRMVLGMWAMLIPLVALGIGSLTLSRGMLNALDRVVQVGMNEVVPVTELQKLLLQTGMPPNDYLILGAPVERQRFELLTAQTDEKFESVLSSTALQMERHLLEVAKEEWDSARAVGWQVFAIPDPVGNREAGRLMEQYDSRISRAADLLSYVYDIVRQDIDDDIVRAEQVRQRETVLLFSVFLGAMLIASAGGFLISRSIIRPIEVLQEGMERFGEGDHSFRVQLDRKDEFGRLAGTMNRMAERLEFDSLTGVYNRHEFLRKLKLEVERSDRYGRVFSLLMVDIDHFKSINDTFGHQVGDIALRSIAVLMLGRLRAADIMARYGGEEFAIIMPETPGSTAEAAADRLRAYIADRPAAELEQKPLTCTVSIGVASFPEDGRMDDDLIAAADSALYQAKQKGRNRVVRHRP